MASHQTFSGQIKHISGQIKFGQTTTMLSMEILWSLQKWMSGKMNVWTIFSPYHKHWYSNPEYLYNVTVLTASTSYSCMTFRDVLIIISSMIMATDMQFFTVSVFGTACTGSWYKTNYSTCRKNYSSRRLLLSFKVV